MNGYSLRTGLMLDIQELVQNTKPDHSLDQTFYSSPELYELELDTIFAKNWIFAGHVSQVSKKGDFFLFELDRESVIIVRDRDDKVQAFANVCRHRGSRICLEHSGSTKLFRCPYHAWAYDLDGQLKVASNMGEVFDKKPYGLHKIHLDIVGGFIFICLSEQPPSLAPAKKNLAPVLKIFGTTSLKRAAHKSYEIDANWKLALENYHECYHCGPAHPEYAQRHTLKLAGADYDKVQHTMRSRYQECGIHDAEFDFQDDKAKPGEQGYAYSRSAMFDDYKTGSQSGEALAPLLGLLKDFDFGASDLNIGPVSFFLIYSDHVVSFNFLPTGLQSCRCDIAWYVNDSAKAEEDYSLEDLTWLWDVTTKADKTIILNNQAGVNSKFYTPGPFSEMEQWTNGFLNWYLMQIKQALV
jgi:phenylpropionate dioxygenase-like ring-hydroxylating dioxygenase large terminal subunit